MDPTLRIARLEQSVFRLRLIVIATTLAATGAAATALVIALREPTEIRIGGMRLDEHSLSFENADRRVGIDATGIAIRAPRHVMLIEATTLWMAPRQGTTLERPHVLLVVDNDRATLAIEGADGHARMEIDHGKTLLELDGKLVTPAPTPAPAP